MYYIILCYIIFYYVIFYYVILYYIILHYIIFILYYIVLYYIYIFIHIYIYNPHSIPIRSPDKVGFMHHMSMGRNWVHQPIWYFSCFFHISVKQIIKTCGPPGPSSLTHKPYLDRGLSKNRVPHYAPFQYSPTTGVGRKIGQGTPFSPMASYMGKP